jgi:hypothetical protein
MHKCHLPGCEVRTPPKYLLCPKHWKMVPQRLQMQVWATYRRGQEIDKRPTPEYLAAARDAIDAVACKESK